MTGKKKKKKSSSQSQQTLTTGCPETSLGDGALAVKMARETTHRDGHINQGNNQNSLKYQILECLT